MNDDERTHGADKAAPLTLDDLGARAAGWRPIARIPVRGNGPGRSFGAALAACLPAPLIASGLQPAVEQAVLTALARRERQTGCLPRSVVVSLHAGCPSSPTEGGWNFFVVERPAQAAGKSNPGETVELCLYCDA